MARTSSFPIYDELKFDGQLAAVLLRWRDEEEMSVDDIVFILRSEHDVVVSRSTVVRWLELARCADEQPQDAA